MDWSNQNSEKQSWPTVLEVWTIIPEGPSFMKLNNRPLSVDNISDPTSLELLTPKSIGNNECLRTTSPTRQVNSGRPVC